MKGELMGSANKLRGNVAARIGRGVPRQTKRHRFIVQLSDGMRNWFAQHARENSMSLNDAVQMGVECYSDSLRIQRRRDDVAFDRLQVPQKDRCY